MKKTWMLLLCMAVFLGIRAQAADVSIGEKVAQMFVVLPEALTGCEPVTMAGEITKAAIDEYPVGGIIYMRENVISEEQFRDMVTKVQEFSRERIGLPMLICMDEEGGSVTRIANRGFPGVPKIGAMYEIGEKKDSRAAGQIGAQIGEYLHRFGVNVDFAPVADIYSNMENTVIGERSFGTDSQTVADMVAEEVKAMRAAGVLPTLKHFPGHGDTAEDSHDGMAYSYKTMEELRACEWIPFRAGIEAGAALVMMGHISFPKILDSDVPASLSETMIKEALREELGFDGVVITDAMNMGAITDRYTSAEAAVLAIEAGADMILMPEDFREAYNGVLEAVRSGRISEERIDASWQRILRLKESMKEEIG